MGRRSVNGVRPKGSDRIEFEFTYKGKRYRPSLPRVPTEANLRRAHLQLNDIKLRIKYGTFNFNEEFPDYRMAEPTANDKTAEAARIGSAEEPARSVE